MESTVKNKKIVWIIDHYSSEPKYGGISRQYDFAMELSKRGIKVVVISSSYSHFTHQYFTDKDIQVNRISNNALYVYLHTSSYQSNNGKNRAKSMLDFMNKVIKVGPIIAKKYGDPSAIMGCSVHPLAWIAAHHLAKKFKSRFIAEVRDLWPEAYIASGEKSKYDPMMIFFALLEKWAFKRADRIICSLSHGDKYICDRLGVPREKVFIIGQPLDCERFDKNAENFDSLPYKIVDFISSGFVCCFTGYYIAYEGVMVFLEAMKLLKDRSLPIKMVFAGSGQEEEMIKYAEENNLSNVLIWGRIPKESVPALISHCDICLAHLDEKGNRNIYKYGISKNKVNEYLYSGACTIFGFMFDDNDVMESRGGLMFKPYNANDLADKIQSIYEMPKQERKKYGIHGRDYIKKNHGVKELTDKLERIFFE